MGGRGLNGRPLLCKKPKKIGCKILSRPGKELGSEFYTVHGEVWSLAKTHKETVAYGHAFNQNIYRSFTQKCMEYSI